MAGDVSDHVNAAGGGAGEGMGDAAAVADDAKAGKMLVDLDAVKQRIIVYEAGRDLVQDDKSGDNFETARQVGIC